MAPTPPSSIQKMLTSLTPKFNAARKSGACFFFDSEVRIVDGDGEGGRDFQIRVCPALKDKQKSTEEAKAAVRANGSDPSKTDNSKVKRSPFEPPYIEDLHVGDVTSGAEGDSQGMAVLLNKYAVVPEHFLLVTKSYSPQHLPPTPSQLLTMYNILLTSIEHPTSPRRLLAFYNGGPGAGASQTWRHAQFVEVDGRKGAPVERWVKGLEVERKDKPFVHPNLPYLHILHHLPSSTNQVYPPTAESNEKMESTLALAMMGCLDIMFDSLRRGGAGRDGGWNLLMTLDHLHLIPRSHPSFPVSGSSDLELNSLGYAGMLLVKSEEELEALTEATAESIESAAVTSTSADPSADAATQSGSEAEEEQATGLLRVLQYCGIPRKWSDDVPELEGPLAGEVVEGDAEASPAAIDSSL